MTLVNEMHTGIAIRSPLEIGIAIHEELLKQEFKPAKPFPKVGDTLHIRHQVKRNKQGDVFGIQRADGKPVAVKITAVYMDGTVRSGLSDVWTVRPATNNTWETINPDREEK